MSDEKHENFDDIAWEVCAQWQGCEDCSLGELDGKDLLALVARFVAAHKRELAIKDAVIQTESAARLAEQESQRREIAELKKQIGNAAKLRDALKSCVDEMCDRRRELAAARGNPLPCLRGCEPVRKAKFALAAPPRNCDVGTAEEQAQRFDAHCRKYMGCRACPLRDADGSVSKDCELHWAQMPYTEGGAV